MKRLFLILLCSISVSVAAAETVSLVNPYNASHAATPALFKILGRANSSQKDYNFVMEFKAGANGLLALQAAESSPGDKVVLIHAGYADLMDNGSINPADWQPIWALGDACWAVITNHPQTQNIADLASATEILAGGVGFGTAAHVTAIAIGEKLKKPVRFVAYKSSTDVIVAMAGNTGPNLGIAPIRVFDQLKSKNSNLNMIAISCSKRHADAPGVKTLVEQGIVSSYIFNTVLVHKNMPRERRQAIAKTFEKATQDLGLNEVLALSDMYPPQFDRVGIEDFHKNRIELQRDLNRKYKSTIDNHRTNQ